MYGKWVTVDLGESIECKVFVWCTPDTPDYELKNLAMMQLKTQLKQQEGIWGLGKSLEAIRQFEIEHLK